MIRIFLLINLLTLISICVIAQEAGVVVKDKMAIDQSKKNLAVNIAKQQGHKDILEFSEGIQESYFQIEALQQKILQDLKLTRSVKDLHWADLSKSLYLANELVKGHIQSGLETDMIIEHPIFQKNLDEIYQELFVSDAGEPLPDDLGSYHQAKQKAQSLSNSFQQFTAERNAYTAVAFQYLSEDLILKAVEMNEVLKQPARFAMTEAERMRLQSDSEEYLKLAGEMLEKSDQLLLKIAYCRPLQNQADQEQKRLERSIVSHTPVLNY